MRRLTWLGAIAAIAAAASPAYAEGPYAGVEGGLYLQNSLSYDFVGLSDFFQTGYAKGFDTAGKLGYDFEGIRIEAELGYKRANANRFGFKIGDQSLAVEHGSGVAGNVNTLSGMINAYWDITQGRFRPYLGAGVGIARVSSSGVGYAGYGDSGIFLDQSDTALAYQLMAGVSARLTPHLYANVGYKYFTVDKVKLATYNTVVKTTLHSSSVVAGIRYQFGRSFNDLPPPARPPAVVPVAPELAPIASTPAVPSPVSSINIGFAHGNPLLSADAKIALDQLAIAYKQVGHASVMLTGSGDEDGPSVYNEKLAARRAATTKAYLVTRGVPATAMAVQSFDGPAPAAKGKAAAATLNISYGPGSGL